MGKKNKDTGRTPKKQADTAGRTDAQNAVTPQTGKTPPTRGRGDTQPF